MNDYTLSWKSTTTSNYCSSTYATKRAAVKDARDLTQIGVREVRLTKFDKVTHSGVPVSFAN